MCTLVYEFNVAIKSWARWKFWQNALNVGMSPDFWLINEANDISNTYGRLQDQTNNNFFKMASFVFSHVPTTAPKPFVFDSVP